ncbi:MAG: M23 family metallopeptidase [Gemmatimonadaceae bacterium]
MDRRRWTFVIMPPEGGRTRELWISRRQMRWAICGAVAGLLLVVAAASLLITPWGTPGARLVAAENAELRRELAAADQRFLALEDTVNALAEREGQMRILAGLAPADSTNGGDLAVGDAPLTDDAPALNATLGNTVVTGLGDRRRPFLGRLGWTTRPSLDRLMERATALARGFDEVTDTLKVQSERVKSLPSIMPTSGWLSSEFAKSRFHPILHVNRPHNGIDLTAEIGTPIVAPAAGVVAYAGWDQGFGRVVEIDHGHGIRTRFAHCARLDVRRGQRVTRGQRIAAVGNSGLTTSPHLHYEIHVNGRPVDPLTFVLPDDATP